MLCSHNTITGRLNAVDSQWFSMVPDDFKWFSRRFPMIKWLEPFHAIDQRELVCYRYTCFESFPSAPVLFDFPLRSEGLLLKWFPSKAPKRFIVRTVHWQFFELLLTTKLPTVVPKEEVTGHCKTLNFKIEQLHYDANRLKGIFSMHTFDVRFRSTRLMFTFDLFDLHVWCSLSIFSIFLNDLNRHQLGAH